MSSISFNDLRNDCVKVAREIGAPNTLSAGRPIVSGHITVHDGYYFPPSKNRSARIHKKLLKRFGGYEKRKPSSAIINGKLYMHPACYYNLKASERMEASE